MKNSELIKLVQDVFGTSLGRLLIQESINAICKPELYTSEANKLYWRAGQVDLIRRWESWLDLDEKTLQKIIESEKDETEFNDFIGDE